MVTKKIKVGQYENKSDPTYVKFKKLLTQYRWGTEKKLFHTIYIARAESRRPCRREILLEMHHQSINRDSALSLVRLGCRSLKTWGRHETKSERMLKRERETWNVCRLHHGTCMLAIFLHKSVYFAALLVSRARLLSSISLLTPSFRRIS